MHNKICAILPGDNLTDEIIKSIAQEVESKLLAPSVSKVSRMVLFSSVPVDGYWRYRNKLVIRRAPDQAPRPAAIMGQHPLMLEIFYEGAQDGFTDNIRRQRESHQWALMLTLLVPGLLVPPRVEFNHLWVVPHQFSSTPGPHISIEAQEVYLYPRDPVDESSLSGQGGLPGISLVEEVPTSIGLDQVLVLPKSIQRCLDIFMTLDNDRREKVLRAAFWLDHSSHVWRLSKSASYQSLIQAVEVLIDVPRNQPKCAECNRSLGVGPTALFTEFLDKYSPKSSDLEPARHRLYNVRSGLSHGNILLHMDQGVVFNWYNPKTPHEHMLVSNARLICRRAIISWLMDQDVQVNVQ
jgi:hypothetical protein